MWLTFTVDVHLGNVMLSDAHWLKRKLILLCFIISKEYYMYGKNKIQNKTTKFLCTIVSLTRVISFFRKSAILLLQKISFHFNSSQIFVSCIQTFHVYRIIYWSVNRYSQIFLWMIFHVRSMYNINNNNPKLAFCLWLSQLCLQHNKLPQLNDYS